MLISSTYKIDGLNSSIILLDVNMLSSRGFLGVLALASTSSFVSGTLYASPYGTFNVGNGDAFGVPGNATYDYGEFRKYSPNGIYSKSSLGL